MHKLTGQIWYFHIKHVDQFFNGPHKQQYYDHYQTETKEHFKQPGYISAYKLVPIKISLIISSAS